MTQIQVRLQSKSWKKLSEANDIAWCERGTLTDGSAALKSAKTPVEYVKALSQVNGFFAVVKKGRNGLFAAVDHIRSIPLYYAESKNGFLISDDAEWLREEINANEITSVARDEFQLAGYVSGHDTLYDGIKQLQAGEYIQVSQDQNQRLEIEVARYFRFLPSGVENTDETTCEKNRLDNVVDECVNRLIEYAAGRQIVVPLSGGYDSRLILIKLKQLGYKNILAFTYGRPGNKDSKYSKEIAGALGVAWVYVPYTAAAWRSAGSSSEFRWYQYTASGLNSVAHVQDWLAVRELKNKSVIKKDCVFVPGHGAMAVFSHLKDVSEEFDREDIAEWLLKKKYNLAPPDVMSQELHNKIITNIDGILSSTASPISVITCWEWQERQAKYLVNSVRAYEFFEFDWWMPLWDRSFVEFWNKAPIEIRKNKDWYINYVIWVSGTEAEREIPKDNAKDVKKIRMSVYRWMLKENIFQGMVINMLRSVFRGRGQLNFEGIIGARRFSALTQRGYRLIGMLALDFIKDIDLYRDEAVKGSRRCA